MGLESRVQRLEHRRDTRDGGQFAYVHLRECEGAPGLYRNDAGVVATVDEHEAALPEDGRFVVVVCHYRAEYGQNA